MEINFTFYAAYICFGQNNSKYNTWEQKLIRTIFQLLFLFCNKAPSTGNATMAVSVYQHV